MLRHRWRLLETTDDTVVVHDLVSVFSLCLCFMVTRLKRISLPWYHYERTSREYAREIVLEECFSPSEDR